ncbi:Hypothetical predicted protein [Mytilus galloprovincialis]|uniref:Uncharacterized protein n=1 Tax=Mytilus galloprovincialis TaxID=29158 RepID=A0A8B6CG74_MYTGA|nr:Hypothetical predicted protein [Mytilus galloprovincialis]
MVFFDKLPMLTARPILDFIQLNSAKICTGWISANCLAVLSSDPKMSIQRENLNIINKELEQIKQDTATKVRTDWEHLNNRLFQAEIGISHKFQLLQTLISTDDCSERRNEVSRLRTGILDTNSGILNNLSVIHQGLVGHTVINPADKGLLEMWYQGVFDNMIENSMSAKTCHDYVMKYLSWAVILQLKGIILFAGANENSGFCLHQFKLFEKNLESQIEKMEKTVPEYMKYLTDPNENNIFIMRPILGGDCDPIVKRQGPSKKLKNDFFCGNIEDGKWHFERSPSFFKDGSLLISGKSSALNEQRFYIKVPDKNTAICVSEQSCATPFYVIPIAFKNNTMKTNICKSDSHAQQFLGNNLSFTDGHDDIQTFELSFESVKL